MKSSCCLSVHSCVSLYLCPHLIFRGRMKRPYSFHVCVSMLSFLVINRSHFAPCVSLFLYMFSPSLLFIIFLLPCHIRGKQTIASSQNFLYYAVSWELSPLFLFLAGSLYKVDCILASCYICLTLNICSFVQASWRPQRQHNYFNKRTLTIAQHQEKHMSSTWLATSHRPKLA
jgi:hypothetical protein